MSFKIILSVFLGILSGYYIFPNSFFQYTDVIIDIGLCILLFFVGIDIGKNKDILYKIKRIGLKILLLPIMIMIGSIVGSIIGGYLMGMSYKEAGTVGAGFGWYTLSAMMLANYSTELSALAFLTNVSREIIALIIIPVVAKHIGYLESIAPAGATAMDTSLPIISRFTDSETAIIAFITGVCLSSSVPIIVSIMINL